jgi:hypothetical protein
MIIRRGRQLLDILRDKALLHGAYQRLFDSSDGKIVLRDLMKKGFVTTSTFVANDPHQTALNEGSRRLVLSILRFVNTPHAKMVNQIEEAIQDEHTT